MILSIILGGVLCGALIIIVLASFITMHMQWRECIGCGRYFNGQGEIRADTPAVINMGHCGVCPECCGALDMGREVHKELR